MEALAISVSVECVSELISGEGTFAADEGERNVASIAINPLPAVRTMKGWPLRLLGNRTFRRLVHFQTLYANLPIVISSEIRPIHSQKFALGFGNSVR